MSVGFDATTPVETPSESTIVPLNWEASTKDSDSFSTMLDDRPVLDSNSDYSDYSDFKSIIDSHEQFLNWDDPQVAQHREETGEILLEQRVELFADIPTIFGLSEDQILSLYDGENDPRLQQDLQTMGHAQANFAFETMVGLEQKVLSVAEEQGISREEAYLSLTQEDLTEIQEQAAAAFEAEINSNPQLLSLFERIEESGLPAQSLGEYMLEAYEAYQAENNPVDDRPVLDPDNLPLGFTEILDTHEQFLNWEDPAVAQHIADNRETIFAQQIENFKDIPNVQGLSESEAKLLHERLGGGSELAGDLSALGGAHNAYATERVVGLEQKILSVAEEQGISREEAYLSLDKQDFIDLETQAFAAFQEVLDANPRIQELFDLMDAEGINPGSFGQHVVDGAREYLSGESTDNRWASFG